MGWKTAHSAVSEFWKLVERQHGVVARRQLLAVGFSSISIEHRIARGRLHPVGQGIYAVGRPELSQHGRWMAAVLGCGPEAVLSHGTAAALWGVRAAGSAIEVTVPAPGFHRRSGVVVHRRSKVREGDVTERFRIPVTTPMCTLVDIASRITTGQLEAAINEADKRDLTDPEELRAALDEMPRRPGIGILRALLDRRTFTLTDSELERRFVPIALRAGLGMPETGRVVNGFKVDFFWPGLGLVVETDGLRYHRTPAQQERDRVRDQAHSAAGLTPLRFTRAQVRYEPEHAEAVLAAVAARLRGPLAA